MAGGDKEEEVITDPKLEEPLTEEEKEAVVLEVSAWLEMTNGAFANA